MNKIEYDYYGNKIVLPKVGDPVNVDGNILRVSEILPHRDLSIVAVITLRGKGGSKEIGYYDLKQITI